MLKDKSLTYISLFSSAGVGCYGFKMEGYHCIATNDILSRRLNIQRINNKCDLETGYVDGDITNEETKKRIYDEIKKWQKMGNDRVDVVVATPPCQGISVINHKKNEKDINRNSLVVESVEIIRNIRPRVFIIENVQAFEKTYCITKEEKTLRIGEFIRQSLGNNYVISGRVLNFMNYGSNSSRTRTLVIGVDKEYRNDFTPYEIYPRYRHEKTLRDVIGNRKYMPLEWGEIQKDDFYHAFRTYDPKMRMWIHNLKEGESAFDNETPEERPHKIVNGRIVENVKKNRDKYTRQKWDRFIQCIHTRNDQLAAQNTIHPVEDRVFSIRELMEMMTIPKDFKWVDYSLEILNSLPEEEKKRIYKENELNIRQCIGEAVPTAIMQQLAQIIKIELKRKKILSQDINNLVFSYGLTTRESINEFIFNNPEKLRISDLQRIVEVCNTKREENAAYYTNKFIVNEIMGCLPTINKDELKIIEPSVGAGGFLPYIFKKYENIKSVVLDVIDIDKDSVESLKVLLQKMGIPSNFEVNIFNEDFLTFKAPYKYDLAIGNPPYSKLDKDRAKDYIANNINKKTCNLSEFFLEKCIRIADNTALVLNKTILSSGEFDQTRDILRKVKIESIIDFGRFGFTGLSIETICLVITANQKPRDVFISNLKYNFRTLQSQAYITDNKFPYFIIYRCNEFDTVAEKMDFGLFDVFRDRQISKSNTAPNRTDNELRVLKARNIQDDGTIVGIDGYDSYIKPDICSTLSIARYIGDTQVYLTPNMTYKPRVIKNREGFVPDGSVAVLIPKQPMELTDEQLKYYSTDEYRRFYLIARNLSTQSINVDSKSVFFYGVLK